MNTPKVRKKKPSKSRTMEISLNGRSIKVLFIGVGLGGLLGFIAILEMIRSARIRKPEIRIDQAKPTLVIRRLTMIGKMTPPRLVPLETIPYARPRLSWNQLGIEAMHGWKTAQMPKALQTPWARRTCGKVVANDAIMRPKTCRRVPPSMTHRDPK
jgi:hypothetical protein